MSDPISDGLFIRACADILRRRLNKATDLLKRTRLSFIQQSLAIDIKEFLKEEEDAHKEL